MRKALAVLALGGIVLAGLWGCTPKLSPSGGPVAVIDARPQQGQAPLSVQFDASKSHDPEGVITDWLWDFGDGSEVISGERVEHTFQAAGEHVVTLVVVGPSGTGRATTMIRVLNNPPVAQFTIYPPDPFQDERVTFDASGSHDPDGRIASWSWDFGDGGMGEGEVADHSYSIPGDYTVVLTVTDASGAQAVASRTVSVEECTGGGCGRR
ncbi:MAG: PKD domain-containing protein [Candidatus Bipolaricaulaceae bacterium]